MLSPVLSSSVINLLPIDLASTPKKGYTHHEEGSFVYRVTWKRWLNLLLFSYCSMMNNSICFTLAPVFGHAKTFYKSHSRPLMLVQVFFGAYALISFPSATICSKIGLAPSIIGGAWLQGIGTFIRWWWCDRFWVVLIGQVLCAVAQCVFVNLPVEFSLRWFGADERLLATTLSVNANALGIALAYTVSPRVATKPSEIPNLFFVMSLMSWIGTILTSCLITEYPKDFPSRGARVRAMMMRASSKPAAMPIILEPDVQNMSSMFDPLPELVMRSPNTATPSTEDSTPNSASRSLRKRSSSVSLHVATNSSRTEMRTLLSTHENQSIRSKVTHWLLCVRDIVNELIKDNFILMKSMFTDSVYGWSSGFVGLGFVFCISEVTLNCFSSGMSELVRAKDFSTVSVSLMGSVFIVTCLVGSAVATVFCTTPSQCVTGLRVCLSVLTFIPLIIDYCAGESLVLSAVVLIGFLTGPLQPFSLETAADVSFPKSEAVATAMLQVMGNFISALFLPLFTYLCGTTYLGLALSVLFVITLGVSTLSTPVHRRHSLEVNPITKK